MSVPRILIVATLVTISLGLVRYFCYEPAVFDETMGRVPAKGQVTDANGTPITNVQIYFYPCPISQIKKISPGQVNTPFGVTDYNGHFSMKLHRSGVKPGTYKVVLNAFHQSESDGVPVRYREAHTTPLEVTIDSRGNTDLHFQVQ